MLETKEQKQIVAGCVVLIIILAVISLWNRPSLQYHDTTDYQSAQKKSSQQQQAYNNYLATLGTSAEAQRAVFEQILPQAQVKAAVENELGANLEVKIPTVADSQIKISSATGKEALQKYFSEGSTATGRIKTATDSALDDIYNTDGDRNKITSLISEVSDSLSEFKKISVPREAAVFHKQLIVALQAYTDLLKSSQAYMADPNTQPWARMYKNYVVINASMASANTEFNSLAQKYGLTKTDAVVGNWLVPKASAQIATVDIWQKAQQALQEAAATSIARFMLAFLDKLANKIEQVYRISNFLYYTDALVSGQYVDDYLNKYVSDPLDRAMAKNFIPEINCGNTKDYSKAFQAKASQYLGYDPVSLSPNDPQYYEKMAKAGDFMASQQGWQLYYQGIAAQAEAKAQSAATNELNSSGQKAGRDITGSIISPVEASVAALRATFQRYLQEGDATRGFSATEQITSQITQTFLNSFVFKGVVYQEQKTCIATPVVQLLTPVQ